MRSLVAGARCANSSPSYAGGARPTWRDPEPTTDADQLRTRSSTLARASPGPSKCSSVEVSLQCVSAVGDRVLTENQPFFPSMPDLRVPPSDQALGCKRSLS